MLKIVKTEYCSYHEQDIIFSKANKLKFLVTEYSIRFIKHPVVQRHSRTLHKLFLS